VGLHQKVIKGQGSIMAIDATQIETIRSAALTQISALLATVGPTVTVGDEELPWAPWLAALERTIDWCDRKFAEYAPYEVESRGVT
jgi:hypothetical protein